jgi:hypothetical protein
MAAKSSPIRHLNLSREGAALQKSVWAELDWLRQAVRLSQPGRLVAMGGRSAKTKRKKKR